MPLQIPTLLVTNETSEEIKKWSEELVDVLRLQFNTIAVQGVTQKNLYLVPSVGVSSLPDIRGPQVIFVTDASGGSTFAVALSGVYRRLTMGTTVN